MWMDSRRVSTTKSKEWNMKVKNVKGFVIYPKNHVIDLRYTDFMVVYKTIKIAKEKMKRKVWFNEMRFIPVLIKQLNKNQKR